MPNRPTFVPPNADGLPEEADYPFPGAPEPELPPLELPAQAGGEAEPPGPFVPDFPFDSDDLI